MNFNFMFDAIHIGYPKCGSTWLQQKLLPALPGVNLVHGAAHAPLQTREIAYRDDSFYDSKAVAGALARTIRPDCCNVFSSEVFAGLGNYGNFSRTMRRLNDLSPQAGIIVVIRNQIDFLESLFKYNIDRGYAHSDDKFFKNYCPDNFIFDLVNYAPIIEYLQRNFERVHVVVFEEFFGRRDLSGILNFLGVGPTELKFEPQLWGKAYPSAVLRETIHESIERNKRTGTLIQYCDDLHLFNEWRGVRKQQMDSFLLGKGSGTPYRFSDETRRKISERFKESNARLSDLLGRDLTPFGYVTELGDECNERFEKQTRSTVENVRGHILEMSD